MSDESHSTAANNNPTSGSQVASKGSIVEVGPFFIKGKLDLLVFGMMVGTALVFVAILENFGSIETLDHTINVCNELLKNASRSSQIINNSPISIFESNQNCSPEKEGFLCNSS